MKHWLRMLNCDDDDWPLVSLVGGSLVFEEQPLAASDFFPACYRLVLLVYVPRQALWNDTGYSLARICSLIGKILWATSSPRTSHA